MTARHSPGHWAVYNAALLAAGWRVHAVDGEPTTPSLVRTTAGAAAAGLSVAVVPFGDLADLPRTDLLYAGYSLPYASPEDFPRVWAAVRRALRPGAWLAVNLFGVHDSFAGTIDGTFLTRTEAEALFDGLDVVAFREEDEEGPSFSGPKHWHVFDVVARAPH